MAKKKSTGRPTKYHKKYCKAIEEFFSRPPNQQVVKKEIIKVNGTVEREYITIPNPLPTVRKFADSIGVNPDTIHEWAKATTKKGKKKYPEFSESYARAMGKAQDFLVDNGLAGLIPPASFIFVAQNYTSLRNKQEVDHTSKGEKIRQVVGFTYVTPEKPDDQSSTNS